MNKTLERKDLKSDLLESINKAGLSPESLTMEKFAEILIEQYKNIRIKGCDLTDEGDQLCFSYVYSAEESKIYINFFRQSILPDAVDELRMAHLIAYFSFEASSVADLSPYKDGLTLYTWCDSPDKIDQFESKINQNTLYTHFKSLQPLSLTIRYEND